MNFKISVALRSSSEFEETCIGETFYRRILMVKPLEKCQKTLSVKACKESWTNPAKIDFNYQEKVQNFQQNFAIFRMKKIGLFTLCVLHLIRHHVEVKLDSLSWDLIRVYGISIKKYFILLTNHLHSDTNFVLCTDFEIEKHWFHKFFDFSLSDTTTWEKKLNCSHGILLETMQNFVASGE